MRAAITAGRPISVGPRQAFVHHHLHRAQHAFFFALGVGDTLVQRRAWRPVKMGFIVVPEA